MRQKSQLEYKIQEKIQKAMQEMREIDNQWLLMNKLDARFECDFLTLKRKLVSEFRDSLEEIQFLAKPKPRAKKKVLLTEGE